jgi:hypothetical protein
MNIPINVDSTTVQIIAIETDRAMLSSFSDWDLSHGIIPFFAFSFPLIRFKRSANASSLRKPNHQSSS